MYCIPSFAYAQELAATTNPLPPDIIERLDSIVARIAAGKEEAAALELRLDDSEGLLQTVLAARIDKTTVTVFKDLVSLAQDVLQQRQAGFDVSRYMGEIVTDLELLPGEVQSIVNRHRESIVYPTDEQSPVEVVYSDQVLFRQVEEVDSYYGVLVDFVAIADEFGLETTTAREFLVEDLGDSAANRSVFLELALKRVTVLRSSVSALPDNTELADRLSVSQMRVEMTSAAMQRIVRQLDQLGIETRQYRGQLLTVTGEITTDVLDVNIVGNLISEWSAAFFDLVAKEGPKWLLRFVLIAFIIFMALQLSKVVQKLVIRGMSSAKVSISYLLKEMISSSAKNLVILFGVLIALSQMGISLGPLLAGLGIAGFIIGFALQDSLSNFASGMLILLYRPFDVGDVVESGGVIGKVNNMTLVNTTFLTFDNQKLVVPNNMIWSSIIKNVTAQRNRRVDLVFGISYGDDIEKAEEVLLDILANHESVLEDPEATVRVHELADSSVNIAVRPWVKTEDYWETYWGITREVKLRFDREGISIPFPQRDVHLFEQSSNDSQNS